MTRMERERHLPRENRLKSNDLKNFQAARRASRVMRTKKFLGSYVCNYSLSFRFMVVMMVIIMPAGLMCNSGVIETYLWT